MKDFFNRHAVDLQITAGMLVCWVFVFLFMLAL